jgi:hypothetical protein
VWGLVAAFRGRTALPPPQEGGGSDLKMYSAITARVAAGENYYRVLADELPARGYATRPVFNWRLPTLSWLNAIPPPRIWSRVLLVAIGVAVIVLWLVAIRGAIPRMTIQSMPVILIGTAPLLIISASVVFYEVWAGLLIAASLACSGLGRWKWSVGLGAAALMIRELALPFIVIMAAIAWLEGRRRETFSWLAAVGVFAVFWAWHISQVLSVMPPDGLVNSWVVGGGWPRVLQASHSSIFLMLVPESWDQWFIAIVVPILWAGSWYWNDRLGRRLALVLSGYFAMFMVVGRADNWYWGFLIAPLIPLGGFGFFFRPKAAESSSRGHASGPPIAQSGS